MMDATTGEAAEVLAPSAAQPEPVEAEPMKLRSLLQKAAQTTLVDSDADAVGRLLQCPSIKVCPAFELACTASKAVPCGKLA